MGIGDIAALKRSPEYRALVDENDLADQKGALANLQGLIAKKYDR